MEKGKLRPAKAKYEGGKKASYGDLPKEQRENSSNSTGKSTRRKERSSAARDAIRGE